MLCVKENIFNLEKESDDFKIFSSNKKNEFLCVYYNFIEDTFDEFINELKKLNGKKHIYMFSMEDEIDRTLFTGIKNFKIEAIPQNILDVYKQLVKMNIPVKTNVIFTDLNKAKNKIFTDKDKDDGARVLRVVLEKLIQKVSQDNGINILNNKGKEEKISKLNDLLLNKNIITKIEWTENRTYLTIGNNAAHGDYEDYDLKQIEKFYRHIQSLLNNYNV
jgi:adenine-specific DNA-methyltransferase